MYATDVNETGNGHCARNFSLLTVAGVAAYLSYRWFSSRPSQGNVLENNSVDPLKLDPQAPIGEQGISTDDAMRAARLSDAAAHEIAHNVGRGDPMSGVDIDEQVEQISS
jgi:hypothetical protein